MRTSRHILVAIWQVLKDHPETAKAIKRLSEREQADGLYTLLEQAIKQSIWEEM